MKPIIKIVYLCSFLFLLSCTDQGEPPIIDATYKINNNSSYIVKLKWRTFYDDARNKSITVYDSLDIAQGSNITFDRSSQGGLAAPFENAYSLIVSFGSIKSNSYNFKNLAPGNLLRYENYDKKDIRKYVYEFTYTITDADYNFGN